MTALDRFRVFTLRDLAVHWGRGAASVMVVTVSAALLVAVFGISGSVTGSVSQLVRSIAGNADIEVSGIADSGLPASVTKDVARLPGVTGAAPMVRSSINTDAGPELLLGVDPSIFSLNSNLTKASKQYIVPLLSSPNGILVGSNSGHKKGDSFVLGTVPVTVVDVIGDDNGGKQINSGHFVLAPLPLAQRISGRGDQIDSILVMTDNDANKSDIRSEITSAVAGRAVVADASVRAAQNGNGVLILRYMSLMGAAVAFVVSAFLIYTVMGMVITQRRPMISMLRAIGGRRRTIVSDMLIEAALLGFVGGLIGSVLGILMGRVAMDQLPPVLLQAVEGRIEYQLPGYAVPVAIGLSVIVSTVASAIAARQVYRVAPIEALAPVGVSTTDTIRPAIRVAVGLFGILALVSSIMISRSHLGLMWAAGALALSFVACLAMCFALADLLVGGAGRVAGLLGAPGAVAGATIRRAPRRIWATMMTICIAVAVTAMITGSNDNAISSAKETLRSMADPDAVVSATPPDVYPIGPILPADLEAKIADVPGVSGVTPGQSAFAQLEGLKVLLFGIATDGDNPLFDSVDIEMRRQVVNGDGIVISRDIGKSLHVNGGDVLEMQTPHGAKDVKVLAVVPWFSAQAGGVGMSLTDMQTWFDRPGSTTLGVQASPGVDKSQLLADLRNASPSGVSVFTGQESLAGVSTSMKQAMSVANAIWVIVVLIAIVALLNTLTLSVLERRREIGVLRAIGSSRRMTLQMVVAEAVGIGVVGGAAGLVIGVADQVLYNWTSTDMLGIDVSYSFKLSAIALAVAALVLTMIGSVPPALRASRINISEAVAVD